MIEQAVNNRTLVTHSFGKNNKPDKHTKKNNIKKHKTRKNIKNAYKKKERLLRYMQNAAKSISVENKYVQRQKR